MRYQPDPNNKYIKYKKLKPRKLNPKNETYEHWFCKIVSQVLLYEWFNCRYVGVEIEGMRGLDNLLGDRNRRQVIDAVGITGHKDKVIGMEAKASFADYRNGFCYACPTTYIVCPKDVVPVSAIPKSIGLIYIDIPNFKYIRGQRLIIGAEIVKRATKRVDACFKKNGVLDENNYNYWKSGVFDAICRSNSIRNVFDSRHIPVYAMIYKSIVEGELIESYK
jgi:hypothetical protein